jgi:hypothetical protein
VINVWKKEERRFLFLRYATWSAVALSLVCAVASLVFGLLDQDAVSKIVSTIGSVFSLGGLTISLHLTINVQNSYNVLLTNAQSESDIKSFLEIKGIYQVMANDFSSGSSFDGTWINDYYDDFRMVFFHRTGFYSFFNQKIGDAYSHFLDATVTFFKAYDQNDSDVSLPNVHLSESKIKALRHNQIQNADFTEEQAEGYVDQVTKALKEMGRCFSDLQKSVTDAYGDKQVFSFEKKNAYVDLSVKADIKKS